MKTYASVCGNMARSSLIQTVVQPAVVRKLDKLAKATGHTRASYLRYLIEMHVHALDPRLAKALAGGDRPRNQSKEKGHR